MQLFCSLSKFGKIIQRGDPMDKKNSKCSNLDETCRTCGDHQESKLGCDFEVVLHLVGVWATKNEKWCKGGTLGTKKNQSAPIWTKLDRVVGSIKKTSWEVILKCACTLLCSERSKMKGATVGRKDDFSQLQPLDQKFLKLSKVHQTCRTGREVFWKCFCNSVVHCRRWKKSEIGQKCSRRNHQKWRVFFKIEFFPVTKSGGLEIYSEQNPLFWEESAWQSQVHDSKECMTVTSAWQ